MDRADKKYCPYHPDIEMQLVRKYAGKTRQSKLIHILRCEECEWNSPDCGDAPGQTCPGIPLFREEDID